LTASQVFSGDSRVMHTIARYLETLRETVDGDELHGVIARTLRQHSRKGPPGPEYLIDLYGQLDAYARDALSLPSMRIRARLLQQHIAPYIADLRMDRLRGGTSPAAASTPRSTAPTSQAAPLVSHPRPYPPVRGVTATEKDRNGATPVEGVLERPSEKEEAAAKKRTEKYDALLRSEKDAWQAIYGTVKDYQRLKEAWLKSLDELARQRDTLENKLVKTTEQLSQLEVEHTKLRSELEAARTESAKRPRAQAIPRLLSRIASRPGPLAKRDGFVRSLEAEIKRIKRSGAPLALGLIMVESLDTLIDRYGAEAATAALRCYTEEVLSNFRAYDLVAVYDRDQFAVMFPDTSKEGARRALEKAYKRAVETHLSYDGKSLPLPPFAGALVTYSAGEDPTKFLQRAGEALISARANGSRGVVLS
jgi:diguanylate cyclase